MTTQPAIRTEPRTLTYRCTDCDQISWEITHADDLEGNWEPMIWPVKDGEPMEEMWTMCQACQTIYEDTKHVLVETTGFD